jgi:hypothetical protein
MKMASQVSSHQEDTTMEYEFAPGCWIGPSVIEAAAASPLGLAGLEALGYLGGPDGRRFHPRWVPRRSRRAATTHPDLYTSHQVCELLSKMNEDGTPNLHALDCLASRCRRLLKKNHLSRTDPRCLLPVHGYSKPKMYRRSDVHAYLGVKKP